jgi:pimeloyl-ACP methyl ester carboxylesterase
VQRSALVPSDGNVHRVNIGGRRLAIWCQGAGSPTVILEHGIGYGIDSDSWEDVQDGVAEETRVCRYDRADVGESDDAKPGRSMPDLAEDLVDLLEAALIPGPYIIVGHSFGGLVVRNFARVYPKSVVGMVLVDGSPRSAIVGLDLGSERLNRTKVLAQLTELTSLGRLPLVVITRGIGLSASWRAAQADMVKLSTSSRQVIATHSDHWIQLRQPDLVIRQILTVLHTIRRHQ